MSVTVTWAPVTAPDIAKYRLERSDSGIGGPYLLVVEFDHDLLGPNYDTATGRFKYTDPVGGNDDFFRLFSVDVGNNLSVPSVPFQAGAVGVPPSFINQVSVDHNFGTPNALQPVNPGGSPIEGVQVRLFKKVDFDAGNTDAPLGTVLTDAKGRWTNPIFLEAGLTYTVQFEKPSAYGPNSVEITV